MSILRNGGLLGHIFKHHRCFSTKQMWQEIRIPGPWGEIAGKWWGPQDKRPILGFHGWQDNAGTFDRLAPLLSPDVGFLAIDLPGHGLSASLPPGIFYHGIDIVILIRKIVEYFKWPKVSLLAHSLGAMNSFAYTMLFPESVHFLICLDGLYPIFHEKIRQPDRMGETIKKFLKYDALNNSKTEPPSYTFENLEQMWHKGSKESINLEACKYVLQRNIAPIQNNPERFYFTRDLRLKVATLLHWSEEDIIVGSKRITCPLLVCMANSSPFMQLENLIKNKLEIIKQNNCNVEYHVVDGTHHVHLNNPENMSDIINNFIKKYDMPDKIPVDIKNQVRVVR